ncbi:MAG TPA: response regulator [Devosiaceae bacterium]|jgi:DNA-binding NtrC family response regulator|nr:response regulator [Devosiaceae bacterium]
MPTSAVVVLVVEDEFLIRLHAMDMLEAAGFAPVEAANADDAIGILESRNDIRVVVTDVDMPGSMDGLRLAHAVREKWPPVKLVLVSGKRPLGRNDLPEGALFYGKPYDMAEVTAGIEKLTAA